MPRHEAAQNNQVNFISEPNLTAKNCNSAENIYLTCVYSEDNKIGIISDLYQKLVTEINKGDNVNVAALGTVLKTMNDQSGSMLENLSFLTDPVFLGNFQN